MAWQQIREMFAEKDLNISRSSICFTEKRTRPRFRVTASELLPNNQAHFVKTSPCRPAFCNLIILNPLVGAGKKNKTEISKDSSDIDAYLIHYNLMDSVLALLMMLVLVSGRLYGFHLK